MILSEGDLGLARLFASNQHLKKMAMTNGILEFKHTFDRQDLEHPLLFIIAIYHSHLS